ncbi:MAG TPA: FAD-binding protein [Burkholderiales bacterium]|nr:FAD-binding protein [Burkholderiales bacterium]
MIATIALPGIPGADVPRRRRVCVRSADDLRQAMQHARHSALTLDASGLDRVLRLDTARELLEVQAAAPWSALVDYLGATAPELSALTADPGLPATVEQSVSANVAGPDGRPICVHVEALTLVTADGELRRASRDAHRELFALAVGGQGVIAVPYSVTLRVGSLRQSCGSPRSDLRLEGYAPLRRSETDLTLLLPPERLDARLTLLREKAAEWRVPIVGAAARRTLPEEETFLRWARREYAEVRLGFATQSALGARVRVAQARRELIETALAQGGSLPPAGIFDVSPGRTDACYPQLRSFLGEKRRHDPADRLYNPWYRRARGLLSRDPVTVRWG